VAHGHHLHRAVQAWLPQPVHPGRPAAQSGGAADHRRWLPRLAGDRGDGHPNLSQSPSRADQSHGAPGARHQRADPCGDAPVWPSDIIVGDAEGVVVIPAHLVDEIADEAFEMTAFEDFVTEEVQKGRSILGLYPPTDEQARQDFAAWRKAKGH
jgi:hypothetical protein